MDAQAINTYNKKDNSTKYTDRWILPPSTGTVEYSPQCCPTLKEKRKRKKYILGLFVIYINQLRRDLFSSSVKCFNKLVIIIINFVLHYHNL